MSITIKTQDDLNTDLLSNISEDYEKSTGFLTGDLVKTSAIELAKIYTAIEQMIALVNVDNLTGDELTKYVLQRKGISRKPATYAQVDLTIAGSGTVNQGDLFATASNIQFESTETVSISGTSTVKAQAVVSGTTGNVGANTITIMPITLTGITSVTNASASYGGYAEETDDSLRERYYEALQKSATSGNVYHYLSWAKSVNGCGNAKVFPTWNGANTVKVVIIDENMQPASQTLIDAVQAYIDPKGTANVSWGRGSGQAPSGAYCTVVSADAVTISVNVDITISSGYDMNGVKTVIQNNISDYLASIAFEQDYVSYAKIGSIILNTEGVKDYTTLTVNSGTSSIDIPSTSVAIMGALEVV